MRCSPILADLLVRRGVTTPEEAESFLDPRLGDLADPSLLPNIGVAVDRIARAVRDSEKITIYGDYDVDGVSSTALLSKFFEFLGRPVACYIPHRLHEGYGMNCDAVRRIAADGTRLIVTVDNGSSSVEEIRLAHELGVDVVIIDHHLPSDPPPRPVAFVNPWLPGSEYPFPHLAGVGVVFKVVWEISRHFSKSRKVSREYRDFMMKALAFAALGTIADVVPLRGENRIIAHYGLRSLSDSKMAGLRALATMVLERESRCRLVARDVGFRIGPCLNSAGRLDHASRALELLLTDDPSRADALVRDLVAQNERRRRIEREIHAAAREEVLRSGGLESQRVLVLAGADWHPGVIGIVASRLVDEFYRPTLLISLNGDRGKGSARSIPQVSIRDALELAENCLDGYGGHAQAAGVQIAADRIGELRDQLNRVIDVPPSEMVPVVEIDGAYDLSGWNVPLLRDLERLEPFGEGNPEPTFVAARADVVGVPRLMGANDDHLSFLARQGNGAAHRAVAFGMGPLLPELTASAPSRVSMVYQPQLSTWRRQQRIELMVRELRAL